MKYSKISLGATTVVLAIAGSIITLAANRVDQLAKIWTTNVVTGLQTCVTILTPCVQGFVFTCKLTDSLFISKTVFTIGSRCAVVFKTNRP